MTKTRKGLQWSAIERLLTQAVQLAIMLILARLLGPEVFGLVGMLTIFIGMSNVFIDSGFTSALIRKIDHTENDLTTAFYYNILMSSLCYLALYFCAPYIANFFQQTELQSLLRVIGVTVLINAFTLIPRVRLTVAMDFKTQAKISILSALISGVVAVMMAVSSYGVWALVAQAVLTAIGTTFLFNHYSPWIPKGKITNDSFIYLFSFGSKLLLSGLLEVIYSNLYQIIIGKRFNPSAVGEFTQANQLACVPAVTLTNIIQRVTYPMLSQLQKDTVRMEIVHRLSLKLAAAVIFPLIMGLAIISKPLLTITLGEQWQAAATLLSILCLGYMLYPIHVINLNLLQVKGRSDLFLKLEVMKKIIGVGILLITIPFGVLAMCVGLGVTSYIALLLNTFYIARLTSISQWQQCKDLLPIWLAVVTSAAIAYWVGLYWQEAPLLQISVSLVIALVCYVLYLVLAQKSLLIQLRTVLQH
ncbi:lipopolysaccharide biosynthesis protein [Aeromonas caviae]|uniref:lipopolysaccharide biosynthesis protein n=1 Tax=Aeromonas caviae TaxID=648 RepID=UPI0021C48474|nr:lipopolysaccharide biosynthesis protein [Aeromonas caviae]